MLINEEYNNCDIDSPFLYTRHDQFSISSKWGKKKQQLIYEPFKEFPQASKSNQAKVGVS